MLRNCINNIGRVFYLTLFLIASSLPIQSSSALAAWSLKSDGVLLIRTKSYANLKSFFQKGDGSVGDRLWIDFEGELTNPRTIKGNGLIKEIRLGKPYIGVTRLVIEFKEDIEINPLEWKIVGLDENTWQLKLKTLPKDSFQTIGEGYINRPIENTLNKNDLDIVQAEFEDLPVVPRNKFLVVLDPGHGGLDVGAIGIEGLRETDVVLEVSLMVAELLRERGVEVKLTRTTDINVELSERVRIANKTDADIFVSIHANASHGKKREINGLETFYYSGWRGKLLAELIQTEILRVSPGSPDRGFKKGRYYVIKNTDMPAVLVEIGFLTGKLDARRLEKEIHRKRLAYAITKGILEYFLRAG